MFTDKKCLLITISKLILVLCYENGSSNKTRPRTFHIGYISGNRNITTGKFDYYNLPGLKIRYAKKLIDNTNTFVRIRNTKTITKYYLLTKRNAIRNPTTTECSKQF